MKSSISAMRLLMFLILLMFSCICSANRRTCFTMLQAVHGFSPYTTDINIADDVHDSPLLSCNDAERLCCKNMLSHLEEVLGNGVAYIRDSAATKLCDMIKLEIPPTDPSHVYAHWKVSNCGRFGKMYLGQICCWKYYIGKLEVFVNNPECTQCEKPDCEHNQTTTIKPQPTRKPFVSKVVGLGEAHMEQAMNENEIQFQETPTNEKRISLRSGKLRGLYHLALNEMEEEEEQKPVVQVVREKILQDLPE